MKFDSKTFNAQAFGKYVNNIPNTKRDELAKSSAIYTDENARNALSSQTGSLYARIPYFGNISGDTSQNNDGNTDISSTNLTTFEQGFVVASRMDGWTERNFSKNITAGVDFMDNVAKQIAKYKFEVKQAILLATLNGIFNMPKATDVPSGLTAGLAAGNKSFLDNHTLDIDGVIQATSLNNAIQNAGGDNKDIFNLVYMHSVVATNLENLSLLDYLTQTDANGIQRKIQVGTWNGRIVFIDDNMPVEGSGAATKYTTYILGENSINLDNIGDSVPYEMSRNAAKNGGEDTLYVRDRYIVGAAGVSFEKPASIVASASNADLSAGANWRVVNNGTDVIDHKAIAIAKIISKG